MQFSENPQKVFVQLWHKLSTVPAGYRGDQARLTIAMKFGLPIGILSHIGFLIAFWALNFPILALYNIFSVAIFTFANWQNNRGELSWAVYGCILLEVPLHAILATLFLGFDAGFWLLVFITVATIVLCPQFSRPVRLLIGFAAVLLLGIVALIAVNTGPIYVVSTELGAVFLLMNISVLALIVMVVIVSYDVAVERAENAQQVEYDRAETLLLNVLPAEIAERLKAHEKPLADSHNDVTVLFADIAGFTPLSRTLSAEDLVSMLNDLFTRFDSLAENAGAEKIKTIGDAYMVATGLRGQSDHAQIMVELAIGMQKAFEVFRLENELDLMLRIGVHSGGVVAGVIGSHKFTYDLWGDTVNIASRMESEGVADRIQMSAETNDLLPNAYDVESRGTIEIKGHQSRECFLLAQ